MKKYFFFILSGCGIIGCDKKDDSTIDDPDPIEASDSGREAFECFPAFEDNELNVVTWNTKFFPLNGTETINKIRIIIQDLDADIIAFQEISKTMDFNLLGTLIPGWKTIYSDVRFGQELGFIYKENAFESFSDPIQLFGDDSNAFPRQPVMVNVKHISGLTITLINIHLKCCGDDGSEEQLRRETASIKLKDYIDNNLDDQAVVVLGDFNDDIGKDFVTPFQNFIDSEDFVFADQSVADGPNTFWSYPNWPSHLDHILISNELFDKMSGAQTLMLDDCDDEFAITVSDHRPVLASFKQFPD